MEEYQHRFRCVPGAYSVNTLFKIGRDVFMGRGIAARDFDLKNRKEELEIF